MSNNHHHQPQRQQSEQKQHPPPPPKPSLSLKALAHNHSFTVSDSEHTQPPIRYAQALYDFPAHQHDELPFEELDLIIIPPLSCSDPEGQAGWLYGENNGLWGWFPDSFVRVLSPQEAVEVASADVQSAGRFKAVQGSIKPYLIDSVDSLSTNYSTNTRRDSIASMELLIEEEEEDQNEDQAVKKEQEDMDEDDMPLSCDSNRSKYTDLVAKATAEAAIAAASKDAPSTPTSKLPWMSIGRRKSSTSSPSTSSFNILRKLGANNTAMQTTADSSADTIISSTPSNSEVTDINSIISPNATPSAPSSSTASTTNPSTQTVTSSIPDQSSHDISALISIPSKIAPSSAAASTTPRVKQDPHNRRVSIDPIAASTAAIPTIPLIDKVKGPPPSSSSSVSTATSNNKLIAILGAPATTKKLWIDSIPGGSEALDALGISAAERKRQEVIYEIICTEKDYVSDLHVILGVYMKKLQTGKVLRPKDLSVIFSNLEAILPVNLELLKRLEARQAQHPNGVIEQIGDIFIKVTDYLKMYTMYCSNHPYALMKLQTVRQTKSVAKFLDAISLLPECKNLDLSNFLLKPIQRICKYPLLVREAIRHTSTYHPDYPQLTTALSKIETVVTIVNEGARQAENVQKMLDLQSRLTIRTNIVMPSRVLRKYGVLDYVGKVVTRGAGGGGGAAVGVGGAGIGKRKRCELYLFNDVLILAKPLGGGGGGGGSGAGGGANSDSTSDKLKLMAMVPFDMILINCPAAPAAPAAVPTTAAGKKDSSALLKELHLIEVVHVNAAKFTLALESVTAKAAWVKALQDATQEWLNSKVRIPGGGGGGMSPLKLGATPILTGGSPSKAASPSKAQIQFQVDGVPVGSVSQLVEQPTALPPSSLSPKKDTISSPGDLAGSSSPRRRVNAPVPISSLNSKNSPAPHHHHHEAMTALEFLKKGDTLPSSGGSNSPRLKKSTGLSDSNDDISLSQIVDAKTKLNKVAPPQAPTNLPFSSSTSSSAAKMTESESEDELSLAKIIKRLPLNEGTTILKSSMSQELGSKGSLSNRRPLPAAGSSTDTLSSAQKAEAAATAASSSQDSVIAVSFSGSTESLRIVSSSRLALNNFIVQDQSKPHQHTQHYLSQQQQPIGSGSNKKQRGTIPHSASMTDTSITKPLTESNVVVTTSLPAFNSSSKESISSEVSAPVGFETSAAIAATTTSTISLPADLGLCLASSKDSLNQQQKELKHHEPSATIQASLQSLSSSSKDSLVGTPVVPTKASSQSVPSLATPMPPPPLPPTSRKPSSASSSKENLSSQTSVACSIAVDNTHTPLAMYTRSHTEQPKSPTKNNINGPAAVVHAATMSATDAAAGATVMMGKNPLVQVSQSAIPPPSSGSPSASSSHTRAFSAIDQTRTSLQKQQQQRSHQQHQSLLEQEPQQQELQQQQQEQQQPEREAYENMSVRERRDLLMHRSKYGMNSVSPAVVSRAMSVGHQRHQQQSTSHFSSIGDDSGNAAVGIKERRSVGVDGVVAEKRRAAVLDTVYSSAATVTMNEEVGDGDGEGHEIQQLNMNKPVKKLVVYNVVQQTGRYNKDFIYIIRVYHTTEAYSIIHQTFDDFFDFHMSLIAQFPEDAGVASTTVGGGRESVRIIPEFPSQMMFVSEAVAKMRMAQLQAYSMGVIGLPYRISRSPYVMKFFRQDGRGAMSLIASSSSMNEKSVEGEAAATPVSVGIW